MACASCEKKQTPQSSNPKPNTSGHTAYHIEFHQPNVRGAIEFQTLEELETYENKVAEGTIHIPVLTDDIKEFSSTWNITSTDKVTHTIDGDPITLPLGTGVYTATHESREALLNLHPGFADLNIHIQAFRIDTQDWIGTWGFDTDTGTTAEGTVIIELPSPE
ncbi:MAG: hypothetical protein H6815_06185 [Phycisphaeraceae bacterium]|nr:hypothetical protein [Phycisphaerales bacterium]MCB9860027.1 hypothetical protein [Phycisphaeraceae bacterium]